MIIDFHVHMGKSSSGLMYTVGDLIKSMDKYGIVKSGLSILNGVDHPTLNDRVYECYKEYPNRIMPFAFINPRDPGAIDEVHRCLGELKFKGIKFHSWKNGYFPDNNSNLDKIIDEIAPYEVPILTHTGTAPLSLPHQWAHVAEKHPNALFVFAHIGYLDYGYGCIEVAKKLDNVMVDTAGQIEIPVLEKAFNDLGSKKIIFATDWPYKPVNSEIIKFDNLRLTEEERKDLFYRNAARILKEDIDE